MSQFEKLARLSLTAVASHMLSVKHGDYMADINEQMERAQYFREAIAKAR